jgi:hypothetical protein
MFARMIVEMVSLAPTREVRFPFLLLPRQQCQTRRKRLIGRKAVGRTFSGQRFCLKTGFDFMIRYSSYRGTNCRTNPSAPTNLLCSLATECPELQHLPPIMRPSTGFHGSRYSSHCLLTSGHWSSDHLGAQSKVLLSEGSESSEFGL